MLPVPKARAHPSAAAGHGLCTPGPPTGDPALLWEVSTVMDRQEVPSELLSGRASGVRQPARTLGVGLPTNSAFNLPQWNRYIPALCKVTVQASLREDTDTLAVFSAPTEHRRHGLRISFTVVTCPPVPCRLCRPGWATLTRDTSLCGGGQICFVQPSFRTFDACVSG